ncbi:hydroxymethylglutaryl-CoA lyase [Psychromarinibacter sp. C21-152]|uniref:Hydroxymethylglutaryl-CoA lyase n=1 Tax=Psychromarinibacter sediminicola TaxID=3033385 RepID=A0AAE3NQM0_9RHOB|nr:hydroxymethylglutaryl-CoA lyase [Psychromarinibacter sediminicola]MDF0600621.1 hydroxymethylglutaryl-CoA lyase [Psychromarinibacter sediminicola]
MTDRAEIFEVGPRDGLQNEPGTIPTSDKVALVDLLSGVGFRRIEVGSFVNPKRVPQMADSAEVFARMTRAPGVSYAALVPNLRGLEAARAAEVDEIAIFASASEGFSRANIGASVADSLARYGEVAAAAREAGVPVRGYVSCVAVCPYDGATPPDAVAHVAQALSEMGCYEVSLGETLGRATPEAVRDMLAAVTARVAPERLAGHFHDTSGQALANIEVSVAAGLRVFDAAAGGLGGCPFAPGAAGNVATGKVRERLEAMGFETGLDAQALARAEAAARGLTGGRGAA